jgi:hypothetical protein
MPGQMTNDDKTKITVNTSLFLCWSDSLLKTYTTYAIEAMAGDGRRHDVSI